MFAECKVDCQTVTIYTQAADDALSDVGQKRVLAEFLTLMHVGNMEFDKRDRDSRQGITQGDAGVGEPTGIDDDKVNILLPGRMDAVD